jgi:HKD family nuclease
MEVIEKNWLQHFLKELENVKNLKIISPFITQNLVNHLLKNWQGESIQVITRFNLNDFRSGVSSISALESLVDNNIKVKGVKGLHSKTYIFDNKSVVITSANFTNGGFFNNYEFGIKSFDATIVSNSIDYFEKLWSLDIATLHLSDINEWKIELKRQQPVAEAPKLKDYGVSPMKKVIGERGYYIKFYGRGDDRADWNETVKELVEGTHCHFAVTFPDPSRRPRRYNEGDIIYMARMITGQEYAIFGKAIARKHVDDRDIATESDIAQIDWKKHYPVYIRVHSAEFLDTTLGNCPKMGQLMNELDYECFESTKRRHEYGEADINPRLALMRKPDVKLSNEGAFWVTQKFDEAKKNYILISSEFINDLYDGSH